MDFDLREGLVQSTTTSVKLFLMPDEDADIRIVYGTKPDLLSSTTAEVAVSNGTLHEVTLSGLSALTRYFYRVECKRQSESAWGTRGLHYFHTMPATGTPFSFAVTSDSHIYRTWTRADDCGDNPEKIDYKLMRIGANNIITNDPVFALDLGDTAQLHGSPKSCNVDGEDAGGPASTGTIGQNGGDAQRQGELRWQQTELEFRPILSLFPWNIALGNHDAEFNIGNTIWSVDMHAAGGEDPPADLTKTHATAARLAMLPNPVDTYTTGPSPCTDGQCYTFVAGDVQIWIVDSYINTGTPDGLGPLVQTPFDGSHAFPEDPDDYTLGGNIDPGGAGQLGWLEDTLAASTARCKILASHHIVGGKAFGASYWYGRGGINSTDGTNEPGGPATLPFDGEQATIQSLMKTHGASVFLYGHDHAFVAAEKPESDGSGSGVHYIMAGQLAASVRGWHNSANFMAHYDTNGDGVADYFEDPPRNGTDEYGHYMVDYDGSGKLTFRMMKTDLDTPKENNDEVFRYSVSCP